MRLFSVSTLAGLFITAAGFQSAQAAFNDNYTQSFETGTLPTEFTSPSDPGRDAGWIIDSVSAADGSYSLMSEQINVGQTAGAKLTLETHVSSVRFKIFRNAHTGNDFRLYLNGEEIWVGTNSLPRGWVWSPTFQVPEGVNELEFVYQEDNSVSSGCNCVRIDQIEFNLLDIDLDGMEDSWELANGLNPADASDALLDGDGDGLNNRGEYQNGGDPAVVDTDGDGLSDGDEVNTHGTSPAAVDTDSDAMTDGWEVANALDPVNADATADPDADTFTNLQEFRLNSDPNDILSVPGYSGVYTESFEGLDPLASPSWYAGDGSLDLEWLVRTSPDATDGSHVAATRPVRYAGAYDYISLKKTFYALDSRVSLDYGLNTTVSYDYIVVRLDGVDITPIRTGTGGLSWSLEDYVVSEGVHELEFYARVWQNGTSDPYAWIDNLVIESIDFDSDGMDDEWELANGFDPTDPADALLDADADGVSNLDEHDLGTDPNGTDSDGDGVSDGDEVNTHGTDPLSSDSDGDLMLDAYEIALGFDPLDPADADADTDGDGLSNLGEQDFGTDPLDASSVAPYNDGFTESFESGTTTGWYTPDGYSKTWVPTTVTASDGSWSVQTESMGNETGQAAIAVRLFIRESALSFKYFHNSGNNDPLKVYSNGVQVLEAPIGTRGWRSNPDVILGPGYHRLSFVYNQNGDGSFCDCVRIDDIEITRIDVDEDGMRDSWELANGLDPADPSDASTDTDSDGLTALEEFNESTDPNDADSDDDTVSDGDEVNIHATDPNSGDSDGDEIPDAFEIANGMDPTNAADVDADLDADGFTNYQEFRLGSAVNDAASEPPFLGYYAESFEAPEMPAGWYTPGSDELEWELTSVTASDGVQMLRSTAVDQVNGWEYRTIQLMFRSKESYLSFDYRLQGSDGNDDYWVRLDGAQLAFKDGGPDGTWYQVEDHFVSEGVHVLELYFRNYYNTGGTDHAFFDNLIISPIDSDGDGMGDQFELDNGLNPLDPADAALDGDGDGLTNLEEFNEGTDPNASDSDGDGLSDGDELNTYGTSPANADTDGDRLDDGFEIANGYDPLTVGDELLDLDGDGVSNIGEYYFGTDMEDAASTPVYTDDYTESFESGTVPAVYVQEGDEPWGPDNVSAADGSWSLKSGSLSGLSGSQVSSVVLPLLVHESTLSFKYYWNASYLHSFRVYVNDELVLSAGGRYEPRGWQYSGNIPLQPGFNKVEFRFPRGSASASGCNCVRIDDIQVVNLDVDFDGMPSAFELANGLDPNDPADGLLDRDSDGLSNADEYAAGTDLDVVDSDGDSLTDGAEVNTHGTNPLHRDTDGDGVEDDVELDNGMDPTSPDDATADVDGDGVIALGELYFGTDPTDASSVPAFIDSYSQSFEGGVMPVNWEVPSLGANQVGWSVGSAAAFDGSYSLQTDYMPSGQTTNANVNFHSVVRAGTTMSLRLYRIGGSTTPARIYVNGVQKFVTGSVAAGSWLLVKDIELDPGYNNIRFNFGRASYGSAGCNCARIDSLTFQHPDADGDGMDDVWEVEYGLDPADPSDAVLDGDADTLTNLQEFDAGSNPNLSDTDWDGLGDAAEVANSTDPDDWDTDKDDLSDSWEVTNGSDPLVADSDGDMDGDGFTNLAERVHSTDPNDAASVPVAITTYFESFEALPPAGWYTPGRRWGTDWIYSGNTQTHGSGALRSGFYPTQCCDLQTQSIAFVMNLAGDSYLSVDYRTLGTAVDQLRIYVDGVQVDGASGNFYWENTGQIPLTSGEHTIEFRHSSTNTNGLESGWIDSFSIVPQ